MTYKITKTLKRQMLGGAVKSDSKQKTTKETAAWFVTRKLP